MRQVASSLIALGLLFRWLAGAVIAVPAEQPTVQSGIDAALRGDTVLVAPGTYRENVNFRGKGVLLGSRFIQTGNPADIDSTVIDGSSPVQPDSASCIIIAGDTLSVSDDTLAAVIGFTITGGTGTRWADEHGAGTFREGGGLLIQYASPRIRHNMIARNRAHDAGLQAGGGGIRVGDGNPRIENNAILGNVSDVYGGGIVLNFTGAVVRNNIIAFDTTGVGYGAGGGIWVYANDPLGRPRVIANNVIYANVTGQNSSLAGGIRVSAASASIRNNIVRANSNRQIVGASDVAYCDVEGGYSGVGNMMPTRSF